MDHNSFPVTTGQLRNEPKNNSFVFIHFFTIMQLTAETVSIVRRRALQKTSESDDFETVEKVYRSALPEVLMLDFVVNCGSVHSLLLFCGKCRPNKQQSTPKFCLDDPHDHCVAHLH